MLALVMFLFVVLFSLVAVKLGTLALEATGLSKDISAFQAQSAFSGVGFTTSEAETVVNHPVRRKILRILMLVGSAGLTTAIATLIVTFVNVQQTRMLFGYKINNIAFMLFVLVFGVLVIFGLFSSKTFENFMRWFLAKPLRFLKAKVELYDYEKILGLSKGYTIGSFEVPKNHWMVKKTIRDLNLEKEGVIILGVYRLVDGKEEYLGVPSQDFKIHYKDKMMVYCREDILANLAKREKGVKGAEKRKEAEQVQKKEKIVKKFVEEKLMKAKKT
ncbi:potassium transporter TrkA [Candidatus Woesearchaeota archaeon]|nr:potassium transporter TrkA [Candidatus Woesearchaeota archaeon]